MSQSRTPLTVSGTRLWHLIGAGGLVFQILLLAISARATDGDTSRIDAVLAGGLALTVVLGTVGGTRRTPRDLLMVWPVVACILLLLVGLQNPVITEPMPGVITLGFAFAGLCVRPNRSWWLAAPAVAALIVSMDLEPRQALVRVPLAAVMWLTVAEVPSRLLARLREKNEELRIAACTDSLTGLLDRTTLDEHLRALGADAAVVVIDLDGFKEYNDTFGHRVGDRILVDFAAELSAAARPADTLFRIGGDEFLVLMPATDPEVAADVVDRLRQHWALTPGRPSFSAGVAPGGEDPVHAADTMMYHHKREYRTGAAGRSEVVPSGDAAADSGARGDRSARAVRTTRRSSNAALPGDRLSDRSRR